MPCIPVLILLILVIIPAESLSIHRFSSVYAPVVVVSGDGNTLLALDKIGAKAAITVYKKIALTYHQISIQNMFGYAPDFTNGPNLNKPVINYNGSFAYLINGDLGLLAKISLVNTGITNPTVQIVDHFGGSLCPPFVCTFTVETDEEIVLYNPNSRDLQVTLNGVKIVTTNLPSNPSCLIDYLVHIKFSRNSSSTQPILVSLTNQTLHRMATRITIISFVYDISTSAYVFTCACYSCSYYQTANYYEMLPTSARTNVFYTNQTQQLLRQNGFYMNGQYVFFYDYYGNMRSIKIVQKLYFIQQSKDKKMIGYSQKLNDAYSLQILNYASPNQPDLYIVESEQVSYLGLNQDASVTGYSLLNCKELVIAEHTIGKKEQIYPCHITYFFFFYFGKCINWPVATIVALCLGVIAIVLNIIIFICLKRYYKKRKNGQDEDKKKQEQSISAQKQKNNVAHSREPLQVQQIE